MNPLAGIGVSIARNCSETQIFVENCRKHRAKRSFWKHCSMKFGGSLARNDHFGSFSCENCRKHRAKRSFWKLFLWNLEEASHETIILEAFSVKSVGSIARNARFGSFFCEKCLKHRTKRSFWKLVVCNLKEALHETSILEAFFCEKSWKHPAKRSFWKVVLWKLSEASHKTIILEAFSVKIVRSSAYSSCGLSHKHHYTNTTTRTPPHQHKNTTTTQKHRHKNTTTQTRPHHHKNTTTKRPAQEHHQKKISTRTPPQTHHHKNTTTKTLVQKHHHTTTKTPQMHHHRNTTNARRCSATHMWILLDEPSRRIRWVDCTKLRILIVFCISGLRLSAYSFCVLRIFWCFVT